MRGFVRRVVVARFVFFEDLDEEVPPLRRWAIAYVATFS